MAVTRDDRGERLSYLRGDIDACEISVDQIKPAIARIPTAQVGLARAIAVSITYGHTSTDLVER